MFDVQWSVLLVKPHDGQPLRFLPNEVYTLPDQFTHISSLASLLSEIYRNTHMDTYIVCVNVYHLFIYTERDDDEKHVNMVYHNRLLNPLSHYP